MTSSFAYVLNLLNCYLLIDFNSYGGNLMNPLKFRLWIPRLRQRVGLKCLEFESNWLDGQKTEYSKTHSLFFWSLQWKGRHAAWIVWSSDRRTIDLQMKMKLEQRDVRYKADART